MRTHVTPASLVRGLGLGGILMVLGTLLTATGAIAIAGMQTAQVVLAADRAEVPDPLELDARSEGYRIVLLADPLRARVPFVNNPQAQFLCDVELADGTRSRIDTGTARIRSETDLGVELGEFEAIAGPTTVTCHWKDDRESRAYFYSVGRSSSTLEVGALIVLLVGLVTLGGAALLLIRGYMIRLRNVKPLPPRAAD